MKLGFGLYRHMLTPPYFAFARQVGATHVVVHLVDYFRKAENANPRHDQPVGELAGWGYAGDPEQLWTVEEMLAIKRQIEDAGLIWEAIENFDPAHWSDVLLDGPRKKQQLEGLKTMIRRVGEVGRSHHRLQLQHRGCRRPGHGSVCTRRRYQRRHERQPGHADSERHGLEHDL